MLIPTQHLLPNELVLVGLKGEAKRDVISITLVLASICAWGELGQLVMANFVSTALVPPNLSVKIATNAKCAANQVGADSENSIRVHHDSLSHFDRTVSNSGFR